MTDPETVPVVTCILRNGADVLLLRRSDAVGSYAGRWGTVAGHVAPAADEAVDDPGVGGDPTDSDVAARREIEEETGLGDAVTLVRTGEPFPVVDADRTDSHDRDDRGTRWLVHPYLFDCDSREVAANEESTECDWARPTAILERETVPDLERSYAAVAPTVESVAGHETHGSAYLSVRALEVLRDRAAGFCATPADGTDAPPSWDDLAELALALRDARPGMAAVANRVNLAMARAAAHAASTVPDGVEPGSLDALRTAADGAIDEALRADDRAASVAADRVRDRALATLSRSGTVREALLDGEPESVLVAESRPGGEGVAVARELAATGIDVSLATDAALPGIVASGASDAASRTVADYRGAVDGSIDGSVDVVLVGADAVFPDGSVVNKVGTHPAGLAAARADVPLFAVCATAKISPDRAFEPGDAGAVAAGESAEREPDDRSAGPAVGQYNPVFEVTPGELVTGVLTEDGPLDASAIEERAERFRALAAWPDAT